MIDIETAKQKLATYTELILKEEAMNDARVMNDIQLNIKRITAAKNHCCWAAPSSKGGLHAA